MIRKTPGRLLRTNRVSIIVSKAIHFAVGKLYPIMCPFPRLHPMHHALYDTHFSQNKKAKRESELKKNRIHATFKKYF